MREVTIQYPSSSDEPPIELTDIYEFMTDCIITGDLNISMDDFYSLKIEDPSFIETCDFEGEPFDMYSVQITGADDLIQEIETWKEQFVKQLN